MLIRDKGKDNTMTEPYNKVPIYYEPEEGEINLDIGAGILPLAGFEHVDVKDFPHIEHVVDVLTEGLPFVENDAVAHIYSSHFLEHITWRGAGTILTEFHKKLKKGGTLELHLPNFPIIIKEYMKTLEGLQDKDKILNRWKMQNELFGMQSTPYEFHTGAYDGILLKQLLSDIGFRAVKLLDNKIDATDLSVGAVK